MRNTKTRSKPPVMGFTVSRTTRAMTLGAALGLLYYLWTLNYNKLGSFYDYSIVTDAAGKFGAGLRPFRDFSSTMQTLMFWLAHACELLFGPRYLALAYGNLLLSLILFFIVVQYAKKGFSFYWAVFLGVAVTVPSSLQHGILWYNSLALVLLSAITLKCAYLLRFRTISPIDATSLFVLLVLSGMTKMNFYAVAIGVVAFFALVGGGSQLRHMNGKRIAALAALAAGACITPPIIETLANHTTLFNWLWQVVLTPGEKVIALKGVTHRFFYFHESNAYYPGTVLQGGVLFCLTVYGLLAYVSIKQFRADQQRDCSALMVRLGSLVVFWGSTCLLILTNVEIESLCLCFCLVGAIAVRISGQFPDGAQ